MKTSEHVTIEKQIHDAITSAFQREKNNEKPRQYCGMSELGHPCDRHLWYVTHGMGKKGKELPAKVCMIFEVGNRIEQMVLDMLETAGLEVTGKQSSFSDYDGRIRGHCDGVLDCIDAVIEIKSASASQWKQMQKKGIQKTHPKYYAQAQQYMHHANRSICVFVVVNKNNSELFVEVIPYNEDDYLSQRNRAIDIMNTDEEPDRNQEWNKWSPECMFCRFIDYCYAENKECPF